MIDHAARAFLSELGATLPLSLSVFSMTGTLLVSGIFTLCGYLGVRRHFWIYMIGIVLYVLDAGVCILVKDYIPLVFHAGR